MTHTPGPWKALGCSVWEQSPDQPAKIQMIHNICNTNSGYPDAVNRGNAALIAAAPDLLDALKNALNVLAGLATGDLATIKADSPAIALCRKAIAKTEWRGRS